MSSMNRSSMRGTGKKKFGKNLNKVTKAPAPPNPSTANARGATSSSRNGLLLLSTKRASGTAAASGGLLSSKAPSSPSKKPMQPLGLTTESYSSAHDALLGAVIGASRMTDTQQPPDAWGVAEKQTSSAPEPALAPKGGVSSGVSSYNPADYVHAEKETVTVNESDVTRERVEQRRAEEEMRFSEQKQRAAERLRQLEQKMSTDNVESPGPVPVVVTHRRSDSSGEPLDPSNGMTTDNAVPAERAEPRTLFDPNRTYSSLVGGKSEQSYGEERTNAERRDSPTVDQEYSRKTAVSQPCNDRAGDEEQPTQPVIHISNYETRDRGERNSNAGPRMLFDPKSGSMVAAPSRDEAAGFGKNRKPKGRKERANGRDEGEVSDNGALIGKPKRNKGRKDERRDRKSGDDKDVSVKEDSKKRGGKVRPAENRLPRTCGVLYKRDERGNCVCVDECDGGDQGYGAHCVPGGRVRNPIEYSKFVAQEKAYQQEGADGLAFGMGAYGEDHPYYATQETSYGSPVQEPEMVQKEIDWVKPDEKIELVTGANDSPTLQATASTWVPSQAALAAAAAAKEEIVSDGAPVTPNMASDDVEESDDDDDNPVSVDIHFGRHFVTSVHISPSCLSCQQSFVGLGFDPTENMDSVMQSPSVKALKTHELDPVELAGLSLDGSNTSEPASRNLFAFGSSTWGGGAGGTDWATLTGPASSQGVSNEGQDKAAGAASFLSLSTGNPWGSPGLSSSGFGGGAAMPGSGGTGQGSTGD